MDIDTLVNNRDVLQAAWERTCSWYGSADWAPQPDFAAWQINSDAWLNRLGEELAGGTYKLSPMAIVPYPKKGGRLRHYCQPTVKDQVALLVFGVLLGPVFEEAMNKSSFGNRWYRGVGRTSDGDSAKWQLRKWSLADRQAYQPYRRAHGLFRKVANWTVEQMLIGSKRRVRSDDDVEQPEDYEGMIPLSALSGYWPGEGAERVYWTRLDLRYAYPSVRIDLLRKALRRMVRRTKSSIVREKAIEASLSLYPSEIKEGLLDEDSLGDLVAYLCSILKSIRYEEVSSSNLDLCFFPEEEGNPPLLPKGDGRFHAGLPTGLALSPLLLNIYLDLLDSTLAQLRSGNKTPFSFVRFSDDIILLSASQEGLMKGIESLLQFTSANDDFRDYNLRINRDKIQPQILREILISFEEASRIDLLSLQRWFAGNRDNYKDALDRSAVTTETRDPFVTNLVERLSDLGADNELDSLPDKARLKLAQLEDIILLQAIDEGVPRETQLVFSATQLARAWLPEESTEADFHLLGKIRRCIAEAVLEAPDKPKLWRSALQAALRHPISQGKRGGLIVAEDRADSSQWLLKLLKSFAYGSDGHWIRKDKNKDNYKHYHEAWPYFASYHRCAFWNAFANVSQEISIASVALTERNQFPSSHTWIFRSFEEDSLLEANPSLKRIFKDAVAALYEYESTNQLSANEGCSLAIAALSLVSRSQIAQHFEVLKVRSVSFLQAIAKLLERVNDELQVAIPILRKTKSEAVRRATYKRLLWLAHSDKNDVIAARGLYLEGGSNYYLLKALTKFDWGQHLPQSIVADACREEILGHPLRLKKAQNESSRVVRDELDRYSRARSIWLNMGRELE